VHYAYSSPVAFYAYRPVSDGSIMIYDYESEIIAAASTLVTINVKCRTPTITKVVSKLSNLLRLLQIEIQQRRICCNILV